MSKPGNSLLVAVAASTAAAITVGSLLALNSTSLKKNPLERLSIRLKSWVLTVSGVENKLIVLLPPEPPRNTKSSSPRSLRQQEENPFHLLIIFPAANTPPQDYITIGKILQELAIRRHNFQVVVAIGLDPRAKFSLLLPWAFNGHDPTIWANFILQKAETAVTGIPRQTKDIFDPLMKSRVFQDMFLWGHSSRGGLMALQAGYPSKYKGVILYGALVSQLLKQNNHHDPSKLLVSYPRPVLTLMGERDGNQRCFQMAREAQALRQDLDCKLKCSSHAIHVKRTARLRKPIIILPQVNHMQMARGILPQKSIQQGQTDFTSHVTLHEAQINIAQIVLDFLQVHSTTTNHHNHLTPSTTTAINYTKEAESRFLLLGKSTRTIHLEPWRQLTDPIYQSTFLADIQRQLLHVTTDGKHPFHFYEDDFTEESSHEEVAPLVDIVPQWHDQPRDFLYAKPYWDVELRQLSMVITEQEPVSIGGNNNNHTIPQLSNTLAFKGRSQEEILFNQNHYIEIKDSPAPTLMELNQQTFQKVLQHMVTPAQRRRYRTTGKQLRFGPDIFIANPPEWVPQPISITKVTTDGPRFYYLWQSTYTTTPMSVPPPFGGAYYGKPLSPAQAYEWIVFDAFLP